MLHPDSHEGLTHVIPSLLASNNQGRKENFVQFFLLIPSYNFFSIAQYPPYQDIFGCYTIDNTFLCCLLLRNHEENKEDFLVIINKRLLLVLSIILHYCMSYVFLSFTPVEK